MAKKKKDPLAAAARQVVKDTANKAVKQNVKQNVKKQQPKQSSRQTVRQSAKDVSNIARNTMRNAGESSKKATVGTARALPKKKAKPFKASDLSGNTGRGVTKQARKQTRNAYTGASQRKAQAKQKEKDIRAGKFNVPNRLSQADEMMLSQEGKNAVNYYKDQWEKAKARGDKAGMQKAHEEAEKIRLTNPATVKTTTYEGPTQSQVTMAALQQYAQAMQAGDEEGMRNAKNLAAYAMLNVPKDNREQSYMTGAYSGGTWGDRALEASESDILKNQGKNLLKSEGAAFASAVPEAAGGYIETVMNAPDINGGSSQLVVKDPNVDKRKASQFDLRGQSRYTEEDARAKADHYQAQAEYLKQIAYATTPLPGVAGRFAVDATAAAGGMGIDLAANTIIPGAGLVSMGARTFGSSVQQAKDYQKVNGTDNDPYADAKAYLYGAAIAGTEIASEKMFGGPWSKIYGKGLLDATVKGAKPTIGKTILKGMLEEGTEELAADIAQWQAPRIYGGETETLPEMLRGAAYDFTLGAALGGLGGAVTAPRQVRAEKVQNLRKRMEAAGYVKDDIDTAFQRMTVGDMEELTDSPDSALEAWVDTVIGRTNKSSQIENQSLTEASGERSSEQTFEAEAPKAEISRGKAWDALRSRLRESGIRDAQMLRTIRDRMSAEEMEEAANLRKNDFLEWRDRVTSPDYQPAPREEEEPTENITAEELNVEEEDELSTISPAQINKLGDKLREFGVDSRAVARAISDYAVLEELVNMDAEELRTWAEEQKAPKEPAKPSQEEVSEMLQEQTEMLDERRKKEPEPSTEGLSGDAAMVRAMAEYLGDAGRSTMIGRYDPNEIKSKRGDTARYVLETRLAYNAGFTGNQISRTTNRVISQETANKMYEAGVMDKQVVNEQRRRKQASAKFYNSNEAGLGRDANGHYLDEYVENLARQSKENAQILDEIDRTSKAFGAKVLFPDAIEVRNKRGQATETAGGGYTSATIMLDKDLGKALKYTYGHELTHRMAEIDPAAYENFKKYVMSRPDSETMYTELQGEYARREIEADHDRLVEETCAEFSGLMISQADMLRDFARMADQNVVQRFFQALRDMARKLTGREKAYVERAVKVLDDAYRERYGVSMSGEMKAKTTADVKAVGEMYESSMKQARKMAGRPASSAITKESDTRFSIKNPVEASGNLVALHNLTEDKLLKSIENGGFPMPSIAVTKADVEHSNFGDITLLMGRDTVDPEADKRNKVYSADVWSPTFPQYEYEPDEKVEKRLRDKFYELSKKHGRDVAEPLYAYGVTLEDTMNRVGGYEGIISREKDNTNMKRAFLVDKGRPIPEDVYKTKINRIPEERINEANAFVENFGEENIANALSKLPRGSVDIRALKEYFKENEDAVKDAFRRTWLQMSSDLSEQDAQDAADAVNAANFRTMLLIIRRIQEGNIETQSQEYDPSASRKAVDDAVDQKEYEAWLEDLFKGVEKKRGIYNGKDFYTPSGNRRSFSQTHFEVTLENIVRAMKSQNEKNTAGFHGSKTVRAASAKSFKNVAQMHEDEGRLQNRTPEEAERLTSEMDSRLSDIINRIYGLKKHSSSDNPFIAFDSIGEIILEVAETGRFTPSNVKNIFSSYEYDLPKDISDDIVQLIKDIQEMPVNIFEAKPQRVVGLDEIVTAIIPDDASDRVVSALEENDIPIERYSSGDNASRMSVVNESAETANVMFSIRARDSDYLQAVRDGDMETAQRMVDEAAKEAGFDSPKLYHGTYTFGFTGIDTKKSNDRISFFATNSTKTAGTYSGTDSVRRIDTASDGGSTLGNYQLYANTDGMIELDAKGADSNHIELGEYAGEYNDYSSGKSYSMYATAKQIAKFAKKRGYSGVIIRNVIDTATPETRNEESVSDVYVFLKPKEQVKSADPITYDNEGNIIPLSERFNPDNPDIRWALRGGRTVEELAAAYGIIPPGEKRAREVRVPQRTEDDNRVSRAIRTIMEAQTTPELLLPRIEEMIANGEFSYNPVTNKESVAKARATINELGYDEAWRKWSNDIDDRKASSDVVTLGWILYDDALKDGNVDKALEICAKMARFGSQLGQAVQALSILKRLPTELQMRMIPQPRPKHVQDKIDEYENDDEDWEEEDDVFAPDEYDEETGLPKPKPKKPRKPREKKNPTQDEVDQMEIDTAEEQAKRAKSTFMEKWNAWRYLAMLFNLRTHDRNIVGNLGFAPIVMSKNLTATVAEIALYNTVGKSHGMRRTKSFYGLNLFHYAWNDFLEMRPVIMGDAKYEGQERDDEKVIFRGILAPVEKARKLNSALLDMEDAWFSRPQYANALAQFMAANGITVEMMETGVGRIEKGPHKGEEFNGGILQEARAYAVKEAQKATYRDLNDVSQFFMRIGKPRSDNNKVERFGHMLIEGIIPFRKTPANILCRAMEYSPAGFAKGMYDLVFGVPRGKKTVAEALDMLCSGFSGTGIFVLGMYLAKMGLLVAKTDDGDDEQKYFSQLLGHQQWALEINGYSITIDWLAPEVVPLFMGAQYFTSQTSGNPIRNISNMLDSASMVIDPVLELSCLSGVQETLDNAAKFAEGDLNTMTGLIATMGLSYMSQGIPTLFGQLERVSQEERMRTFTTDDPERALSADWQYQIGKISAKIPGWDYHQIPYVDSWGNTETETNLWKRIVSNMVSPAYFKKIDDRAVNKELQRLYDATGDGRVLPDPGWKTYTYKDENGKNQTYFLTEEEYLAYGRAKGRNNFDLVQKFIKSPAYQKVSDADKAEIIDDLYYYGEYKASSEYIHNYRKEPYSWVDNYNNFSNQVGGYDVADFIIVRNATQDVKGLKDPKHPDKNAISGTSACSKVLAIYNSGASVPTDPEKHEAFMEALDVAKTYRGYNKAQAEEFLNKTKKKYGITD